MEGGAGGVGGHCEDDLWTVVAVVAAMSVAGDMFGTGPFEVNTREVIEHQAHWLLERAGGETFFQSAPVAGDCVHGLVEVVLVKALVGRESARAGKERAVGLFLECELGTGKKQSGENHRLDEGAIAGGADAGQEMIKPHRVPRVNENGQPAAIQSMFKFDGISFNEGATGEGLGNELSDIVGQLGDIADGAGAWSRFSSKGWTGAA